jgi:transposase
MSKKERRNFSSEFKAKVVIEALKERYTIEELSAKYELHPNQIGTWKKEFIENAATIFQQKGEKQPDKKREVEMEKLYAQIGQQKMEIEWMKKKLL